MPEPRIVPKPDLPTALRVFGCAAATWSVLCLGVHLWPFEARPALRMVAPANVAIIIWTAVAGAALLRRRARRWLVAHAPPAPVWCFLAIAAASLGVSPDLRRSAISLAKLVLLYVGGFTLLSTVSGRRKWVGRLCGLALAAACIAVAGALAARLAGWGSLGFFARGHKYGTVTAILLTVGTVHVAAIERRWACLVVLPSLLAGLAAVTLGGLSAMAAGLAVGTLLLRGRAQLRTAICLAAMAAVVAAGWNRPVFSRLRADVRVHELDSRDIRQRYIEWQAQLNILRSRPVGGTGLGCVNAYRSMFYGRLPKRNTVAPFDRNGWLLVAAETGAVGLAAFVWVLLTTGARAWRAIRLDGGRAVLPVVVISGLVAACVAHTFSSVNYNGVLGTFVLVLVLGQRAGRTDTRGAPDGLACPDSVQPPEVRGRTSS